MVASTTPAFGRGRYSVARMHGRAIEVEESRAKQQRKKISASDLNRGAGDRHGHKIVDVVGVSTESGEDAGRNAVETAAGSLRDLRVAEVTKMDMKVENGR